MSDRNSPYTPSPADIVRVHGGWNDGRLAEVVNLDESKCGRQLILIVVEFRDKTLEAYAPGQLECIRTKVTLGGL